MRLLLQGSSKATWLQITMPHVQICPTRGRQDNCCPAISCINDGGWFCFCGMGLTLYLKLVWDSLCTQSWPQTYSNPPVSASQVRGIYIWTTPWFSKWLLTSRDEPTVPSAFCPIKTSPPACTQNLRTKFLLVCTCMQYWCFRVTILCERIVQSWIILLIIINRSWAWWKGPL